MQKVLLIVSKIASIFHSQSIVENFSFCAILKLMGSGYVDHNSVPYFDNIFGNTEIILKKELPCHRSRNEHWRHR